MSLWLQIVHEGLRRRRTLGLFPWRWMFQHDRSLLCRQTPCMCPWAAPTQTSRCFWMSSDGLPRAARGVARTGLYTTAALLRSVCHSSSVRWRTRSGRGDHRRAGRASLTTDPASCWRPNAVLTNVDVQRNEASKHSYGFTLVCDKLNPAGWSRLLQR